MGRHGASQDSQEREIAEDFDIFDVTSSNSAKFEYAVRKEFPLYQKDYLNYVRGLPVLKWI